MKTAKTVFLTGLLAMGLACGYSKSVTPPSPGTIPTITQLSPPNTSSGGAAFVLTVDGTNFQNNATVNWNGTAQPTTPVTASQLTATIPASAIAATGSAAVTVTNPGKVGGVYGGGTQPETSNSMTFNVN